ncbi:uncharacterized protein C8Q71DRAFT_232755 [Rhodofomes roseus]|uniref:Uncharacterized protein n=1 Tax=Rhodofomes roseus TaxID=34475 RepID=A0A4Y9YTB8_9APHY|nr:uncharacterized protein C8Q71DRAFT_232755 [Rhodofomes roseus]KAH9843036.1 hypothetical protein C8Q71DRAFT_232755 [Rhodofomes roseus]TFY65013.1 hypothetical protein EVJ58_g2246 [Rhodofomes roseus]
MAAPIVSPQPRSALNPRLLSSSRRPATPSPHPQDNIRALPQRRLFSPPRLSTPVDLFDPRASRSQASKPTPSCSSVNNKRRRNVTFNSVRSPRRRHCLRTECPVSPLAGPEFFDHIPWISQLDRTPESTLPMDIADLPMPMGDYMRTTPPCSGPVRTRKSSLRSNPLAHPPGRSPDYAPPDLLELPVYALLPSDRLPSTPRTPIREAFVPSDVRFFGLRPALNDLDDHWPPSDALSP